MSLFDAKQVRRAFGRAARSYEAAAALQREVEARLMERLDYLPGAPRRVLDIGSGPGRSAALFKRRWPGATVIALDMALPMLRQARRQRRWWRPFQCVCADAAQLPIADASIDLLFSNLCVQWLDDLPAALREWRRVLRPGGLLLLSTFGPDTLKELREAFASVDAHPHVSRFLPIQAIGDALLGAGLRDPVLDADRFTLSYAQPRELMRELQALGASNALRRRRRSLTGKGRMRAVFEAYEAMRRDGRLPSTWEVIYAHAWGPPPGQPARGPGGEIASFPADRIPVRRKGG